jgi:hypothetical protein
MVLNECIAGEEKSRWRLRQESSSGGKSEPVYVTGVVYSGEMSKLPSSERRSDFQGENISLITRAKTPARDVTDIRKDLFHNFPDLEDKLDVPDDKVLPPAQVKGEYPNQNLFLEIVDATASSSPNLNIFDKEQILSSQQGDALILGGNAQTILTLEAPKNRPPVVNNIEWETMDEIRVTADTTGRNYRSFQSSERQDPFSVRHERLKYGEGDEEEERYRPTRDCTIVWARDALAITRPDDALGGAEGEPPSYQTGFGQPDVNGNYPFNVKWVRPGSDKWRWISSHYEASGGYFAMRGDIRPGTDEATFFLDLTPVIAPDYKVPFLQGERFISIRVFGSEEIESQRRIAGRVRLDDSEGVDAFSVTPPDAYIGMAAVMRSHDSPDIPCGIVKHGETLVSRLDVYDLEYPEGNRFRYILGLKLRNRPGVPCTFSHVEVALQSQPRDDTEEKKSQLVAGTPGSYNLAQHENYTRAEHWDGMMPTRGRVGFIAMGRPGEVPTLEEAGKLAAQLTTFNSGDVPGLINVNTAPRGTLICLPWASPPVSPSSMKEADWEQEFLRMYDWNSLMTQAVTNARQEAPLAGEEEFSLEKALREGYDKAKADDDGDGFIDEGPYETIGDLARAIRTVRWMLLGLHKQPAILDWSDNIIRRGGRALPRELVRGEIERIYGPVDVSSSQYNQWIQERIARLEKEIFSRVSNLITVQSNVYEIITRAGVVARVPETAETLNLATQTDRMIADRR